MVIGVTTFVLTFVMVCVISDDEKERYVSWQMM